jgi:neutral ceramidase
LGELSNATIEWEIGQEAIPRRYRFVYNGDAKDSVGKVTPFQGISETFEVI